MPKQITETIQAGAAKLVEADTGSGRYLIQLISPGWGSSGYYSPQVLEQAATDRVIPAGTHMYADHPTPTEQRERPVRSIRDLMAVTTGDATLTESGALVAPVQVMAPYRELVEQAKDAIGVSIRGDATDITTGEAEGRTGRIIEGLAHVASVDFVTRPGRGGKILQLIESARAQSPLGVHAEAMAFSEATYNDLSQQLGDTVRATYSIRDENTRRYAWVRDFDDTTVWFEVEDQDGSTTYAQAYDLDSNGQVVLQAVPHEVVQVTTFKPVTADATDTTATEAGGKVSHAADTERLMKYWAEGEGALKIRWGVDGDFNRCVEHLGKYVADPKGLCSNLHVRATGARPGHAAGESALAESSKNVPSTRSDDLSTHQSIEEKLMEITESEHARLTEAAERVTVLEAERDTAITERDTARGERDQLRREQAARRIVAERANEGGIAFNPLEEAGLVAQAPAKDDGTLDEAAFTTTVDGHVAAKKKADGAGSVRGFGGQVKNLTAEESASALDEIDAVLGITKGA